MRSELPQAPPAHSALAMRAAAATGDAVVLHATVIGFLGLNSRAM